MRIDSFARGVAFAALAGAGFLPLAVAFGTRAAQPAYLVALTVLYTVALAAGPRVRLALGALATALGLLALWAAGSLAALAWSLTLSLSGLRAASRGRARPAHALVLELALATGGLAVARFLSGPDPASTALAIWGFFLVQSLYFVGAEAWLRRAGPGADPFERAHARALALLDGES